VRADISEQLGLTDPRYLVAGFDRPNLALRVVHVSAEKEKLDTLKRVIKISGRLRNNLRATRKTVEQIAAKLKMAGSASSHITAGWVSLSVPAHRTAS